MTSTTDDSFKALYTYLDKQFSAIEKSNEELKLQFHELQKTVDAYAKKAGGYFQEMLALSSKVDQHERWLQQIAEKIGVKLDY